MCCFLCSAATTPYKHMPHLDFLEKIAEGFVVEAYNSTKSHDRDKLSLTAYNLPRLERALKEMRGEEAPSSQAQGASPTTAGAAGGKSAKRRLEADVGTDGRLTEQELEGEKHPLIDGHDAVAMGLIEEKYRKESLCCSYKFCKHAAANKDKKSGQNIKDGMTQKGRSKCQGFCAHPRCMKGFHQTCHAIAHRLIEL